MNYYLVVTLSYSIIISAIAGITRLRKIEKKYLPFILYTCIAAINEVLSYYTSKWYHSNAVNNNIFALSETLLITYQIHCWNRAENERNFYRLLLIITLIIWAWEYRDLERLRNVHLYFRLWSALVIVIMCIRVISRLLVSYRKSLLTHPVFLICSGLILFFTFEILTDTFWIYGIHQNTEFQSKIFYIMIWINLFVNLIYAAAILCIPSKPRFIQLY